MFLVNSRYPRFAVASLSSKREAYHLRRHAFSRSYGINLQSSLTTVISSALGYSPHPPVLVWGTSTKCPQREAFLGSMESATNSASVELLPHHTLALAFRFYPKKPAYMLRLGRPEPS